MFNISVILGIILSICNSTNYFNTEDAMTRLDVEKRIMYEVENRQIGRWQNLSQREDFVNLVRISNRLSEQELRDALERIF